jgi:hypothetical protein
MVFRVRLSSLDGADDFWRGAFEHDMPAGMADPPVVESRNEIDSSLEDKEYKLIK